MKGAKRTPVDPLDPRVVQEIGELVGEFLDKSANLLGLANRKEALDFMFGCFVGLLASQRMTKEQIMVVVDQALLGAEMGAKEIMKGGFRGMDLLRRGPTGGVS